MIKFRHLIWMMIAAAGLMLSAAQGERFDIEIPAFSLDSPGMRRTVN